MNKEIPVILKVVSDNMCISCGACKYACPHNAIVSRYCTNHECWSVSIENFESCGECPHYCDMVCPSIRTDFNTLVNFKNQDNILFEQLYNEIYYTGYSKRYRTNSLSSSGGIIRSLIHHFLDSNIPVICLTSNDFDYQISLLDKPNQIDFIPGSIYHSISFIDAIALLQSSTKPVVLVANPCQLEGIYNYIFHINQPLRQKILLSIGLICGWMYSIHAIKAMCLLNDIHDKPISVTYRGENKVGFLKIQTANRCYSFKRRNYNSLMDMINYSASFSRKMNILRCRVCRNHLNILSDISVGDAWLKRKSSEKDSIIILRSRKAVDVINLLGSNDFVLEIAYHEDIIESQSENIVYGLKAKEFNHFLVKRKYITPQYIFSDQEEKIDYSKFQKPAFHFEMFIRNYIIRKRYYSLYRILYIIENFVSFFYQKTINKFFNNTNK